MKTLYIIIFLILLILVGFWLSEKSNKSNQSGESLIKECAGYDWSSLSKAKKDDKPASFYLLANEINILTNIYALVNRSFVISPADIKKLNLKILTQDENQNKNIGNLLSGMKTIYRFLENNDLPVQKYIDRLNILEEHFKNYAPIDDQITNVECKKFLLGLFINHIEYEPVLPDINNYNDLSKLIIQKYNSFLIQYGLISK